MKPQLSIQQGGLIVFAVVVAIAVANYDKLLPHRWQTYIAPDGSFSVELPGQPAVETAQVPLEGGGTTQMRLISVNAKNHISYTCSYVENGEVGRQSPDDALDSIRDGSLLKTQGVVISQKRMKVQGFPALEMQARARGNSVLDSRMVVAEKRVYMLFAVSTRPEDREAKTIHRIFNSFKIIKH